MSSGRGPKVKSTVYSHCQAWRTAKPIASFCHQRSAYFDRCDQQLSNLQAIPLVWGRWWTSAIALFLNCEDIRSINSSCIVRLCRNLQDSPNTVNLQGEVLELLQPYESRRAIALYSKRVPSEQQSGSSLGFSVGTLPLKTLITLVKKSPFHPSGAPPQGVFTLIFPN